MGGGGVKCRKGRAKKYSLSYFFALASAVRCVKLLIRYILEFSFSFLNPIFMGSSCSSVGKVAWWLMVVGAVNWGLVGVGGMEWNVVERLLGTWPVVVQVVYVLVGLSAVYKLAMMGQCKK